MQPRQPPQLLPRTLSITGKRRKCAAASEVSPPMLAGPVASHSPLTLPGLGLGLGLGFGLVSGEGQLREFGDAGSDLS